MRFENCSDPTVSQTETSSNSFYPPGLVCAKEEYNFLCPAAGESGSPLMTLEDQEGMETNGKRFKTEGILSFIKGCDNFAFGKLLDFVAVVNISTGHITPEDNYDLLAQRLFQYAENPLAYTRLHCYLPWIAEQYGLDFDYAGVPGDDPTCSTGFGDPDEGENLSCTNSNTPSSTQEFQNEIELPCLFPYYMDGKLINDSCYKFNADTFLDPVSSCPIWNVTTKINGINNYNSSDFYRLTTLGYCPGEDGATLDPEVSRCLVASLRTPFSKCRNSCKGGKW